MNPIPPKKKTKLSFIELFFLIVVCFLSVAIPLICIATIIKLVRYILFVL